MHGIGCVSLGKQKLYEGKQKLYNQMPGSHMTASALKEFPKSDQTGIISLWALWKRALPLLVVNGFHQEWCP